MLDFSNPLHIGFTAVIGAVGGLFLIFCLVFIFKKRYVRGGPDIVLTIFNWLLLIIFAFILAVCLTAILWTGVGFAQQPAENGNMGLIIFDMPLVQYPPASVWAVLFSAVGLAVDTLMGIILLSAATFFLLLCVILHEVRAKRKPKEQAAKVAKPTEKKAVRSVSRRGKEKPERTEPEVLDMALLNDEEEEIDAQGGHADGTHLQTESSAEYGLTGERFNEEFLKNLDDETTTYSVTTPNREELEDLMRRMSEENSESEEFGENAFDADDSDEEVPLEDASGSDTEDAYVRDEAALSSEVFAQARAFVEELEKEAESGSVYNKQTEPSEPDDITVWVQTPESAQNQDVIVDSKTEPDDRFDEKLDENLDTATQSENEERLIETGAAKEEESTWNSETSGMATEDAEETNYPQESEETKSPEEGNGAEEPEDSIDDSGNIEDSDTIDTDDSEDYADSAFAVYQEQSESLTEKLEDKAEETGRTRHEEFRFQDSQMQDAGEMQSWNGSEASPVFEDEESVAALPVQEQILDDTHPQEKQAESDEASVAKDPIVIGDRIIMRSRPMLPPGYVLPIRVLSKQTAKPQKTESKTGDKQATKAQSKQTPESISQVVAEKQTVSPNVSDGQTEPQTEKAPAPKKKTSAAKKKSSQSMSRFVGRKKTTKRKSAKKSASKTSAAKTETKKATQSVNTGSAAKQAAEAAAPQAGLEQAVHAARRYEIIGRGNAKIAFGEYLKNK